MRHLSSKKCVHRDLAARNVLLDENYVAKVTDFGLSRDVYEAGVYQVNAQSKMPLKWMAVESLESMEFTTQSDVWSFAVLIWEIETAGTTPYPGLMGRELFQDLVAGHRLEQPPSCPDELYELMSKCWSRDPA
ncbi:tyrosine-protein kinase receptor Tie-1, partial [Exaiptasia diaphana]|uniref:Protein kinase domain-containing protein n=1 Tax=Exaiptasia diaphana TaxID=2652724 RepID=A0A913YLE2_EXADI